MAGGAVGTLGVSNGRRNAFIPRQGFGIAAQPEHEVSNTNVRNPLRNEPPRYTTLLENEGEPLMHKEDVSCSLLALMAGATVGAGVGLLFAPQTGSQFRSSL